VSQFSVHAQERFFFMGEQEDPDLDGWAARGIFVYGVTRTAAPSDAAPAAAPRSSAPNPAAGLWVLNGMPARWVKCGCGKCYMGPCPSPVEGSAHGV
jgi:hypothetical protein